MGLFSLGKKVEAELMQTEKDVFRIKKVAYLKRDVATIQGCVLKGTVEQGDSFVFMDKEYEIPCIRKGTDTVLSVSAGEDCIFLIR